MYRLKYEIIKGVKKNRMSHCILTSMSQGPCTLVDFSVCFCVSMKIHKMPCSYHTLNNDNPHRVSLEFVGYL
jgi:hypothetical protein